MARSSTLYNFDIELADTDRGVYESLALRVAQHPSETEEYLLTRVLAYCLEYDEGIEFSSGLSDPDEPALTVRDLTGTVRVWGEIGAPDGARLHRASKAADRVVVYTHKDTDQWLRQLSAQRLYRPERIEIYSLDRTVIATVVGRLERRMAMTLSVADRHMLVALGDTVVEGNITRHRLGPVN